jgi:hypothetical protein
MANAYMNKLNKARKSGAKSFEHNGNTYVPMCVPKQKREW